MEVINMKFRFNFNLETWIKGVEVEGNSYEDAIENLYKMSLKDYLEEGDDDETTITDIDGDLLEKTIKVRAYDIEYDIEEDDYEDKDEYIRIINSLPNELVAEIYLDEYAMLHYSEEECIADEITYKTDYQVKDFKYIIIEEY
jgi:hypothetical protein